VSDRPRDEDELELEKLLSGQSALSQRYRELSDEKPPAQVDAAILASSRWAVNADKSRSRSGRFGWTWPRFSLMRWSVPLGMAAVVVVAATLTLTIQRDPEIDRLYDKYDEPSSDIREDRKTAPAAKSEVTATGEIARESVLATPQLPAPPSVSVPRRGVPASPSTKAKERTFQKDTDESGSNLARKRSNQSRAELAANASGERDAPAPVMAERKVVGKEQVAAQAPFAIEGQVADVAKSAEVFPDSDDAFAVNEPADVAVASAEVSSDEFAIADAPASSDSLDALEAEEVMKSASEASPGRQQPQARLAESEAVGMPLFSDQDAPTPFAEAEVMRDPGDWVGEIEQFLAEGKRDEAIASLEKFRLEFPYYPLPEDLQSLLPSQTD
jgi:hypothetical protein